MREIRNSYKTLVGKYAGKSPVKRSRRRWENNIKMHVKGVRRKVVEWIHMTQDDFQWRAAVKTVLKLQYHIRRETA
jgi:ABC-type uncharacterized transport system ATPase subunit